MWLETYKYRGEGLEMKVRELEVGQTMGGLVVGHCEDFVMNLV